MLDKIITFLKDILIPKKCYSCKNEGHFLCENCSKNMDKFNPICYICKMPSHNFSIHNKCKKDIYFDNLILLYHYKNNIIKKLIKNAKFYNKKDIFIDFGNFLSIELNKYIDISNPENYIIIPTPLHFFRKLKRGYNQSDIISNQIGKNIGIKLHKDIIYKAKHTRQQSQLSKIDRVKNLNNAFNIRKNKLDKIDNFKNRTIIIVDDVVSSGTTINEISKVFKEKGAKKIIGLVIASD